MPDCLVTTLPGVCTNTALFKLGALRIQTANRSGQSAAPCSITLTAWDNIVINAEGGYFTDSEGAENLGTSLSVPANSSATVYPANTAFSVSISNRYALTYLSLYLGGGAETAFTLNLSDLSHMDSLTVLIAQKARLTGNLSALSGLTGLGFLNLSETAVSGNLSALRGLTGLNVLNLSGTAVTGNLSALYDCNLTELYLADTAVSGDLAALREHCPNLTSWNVSGTSVIESSGGT